MVNVGVKYKYCVIGYPIAHSQSPQLHNAWFKEEGIDAHYEACEVSPKQLESFMQKFRFEYEGANVTIPHKETIMQYLDKVTPAAQAIGAVNTIVTNGKKLVGHNTDVIGFLKAIECVEPTHAIVLGAGGAARAIVYGLVKNRVHVTIVNRTVDRAESLAKEFKCDFAMLVDVKNTPCDLLVNATSVGMMSSETPLPNLAQLFEKRKTKPAVMDIIYTPLMTQFLQDAESIGCPIITGDTMFVEQARASFELWRK